MGKSVGGIGVRVGVGMEVGMKVGASACVGMMVDVEVGDGVSGSALTYQQTVAVQTRSERSENLRCCQ